MPIFKRCPHCGKRMPEGTFSCGCGFKREYTKPTGTRVWYHSDRWQKLRATVLSLYDGLDQYALAQGRIEPAETVHHIEPAEEKPELFWIIDNLIPVSRASHDEIHVRYRTGESEKQKTQALLRSYLREFG